MHRSNRLLSILAGIFNDGVMGLLALVALATALAPLVFNVGPALERAFTIVEWTLVGLFAAEFCVHGAVAEDRRAWLRSPWRVIDVLTVIGPIVALLPRVSDVARGSLMLRMLRVGRAVAFGTRAGSVAVRAPGHATHMRRGGSPLVSVVAADGNLQPVRSDWGSVLGWTKQPAPLWFHAANLDGDGLGALAEAASVSPQDVLRVLDDDQHARLSHAAHRATVILQMPTVAEDGFPSVHRDRVLAIVTRDGIVTATTGAFDLQTGVAHLAQRAPLPPLPFPARIACAILALARERNVAVARRFDEEARRLEALDGGGAFLQDTFRLRREISATALDLWHLKAIIRALAEGKARFEGLDLKDEKYLDDLLGEAESLYETVNRTKEDVKNLIELHINLKSFETNGFLKLLAVVSFLGLIPSVVGGMLGMNVMGNPWPVTLSQVAFGVTMGMATALYVFAVKGWLK